MLYKYLIGKYLETLINRNIDFIKFCIVGIICAIIDWCAFSLFSHFIYYQIAVFVGFGISFLINFWLTSKWTFHKKPTKHKFIGMFGAHIFNLFIIRMGILSILVEIVGLEENIAYIPTLIIAAITSFIMIKYVFNR